MRQPPNAQWAMTEANFLPSGADRSSYLIEECEFPDKNENDLPRSRLTTWNSLTHPPSATAWCQFSI